LRCVGRLSAGPAIQLQGGLLRLFDRLTVKNASSGRFPKSRSKGAGWQHGVAKPERGGSNVRWRGAAAKNREARLEQITDLLARMEAGDAAARDALFTATYDELRRLARSRLREGGRNTVLGTTSLVHESYLRFVRVGQLRVEDRRAFFGYASRVMRSVIVDSARKRLAECRGGGVSPLTLTTELVGNLVDDEETILKVHEALEVLAQADARLAQVVEMRYFCGYSEREIAETLQVTERTVQSDWAKARLILGAALK
jgi:RNA polymerase sigma factor (TIGR02999 family)